MTALSDLLDLFCLAILRVGVGIGEAVQFPAYSMLADYYSPKLRAT